MSNIIVKSFIEEFSELLSNETYRIIKAEAKKNKVKYDRDASTKFLKYFIKNIVHSSLTELTNKNMSPKEAYTVTKASFLDIKSKIQDEVANGFEEAFLSYAGQQMEYFCTVEAVPEPINQKPI